MKQFIFSTLAFVILFSACQREGLPARDSVPQESTGGVPLVLLAEEPGFTHSLDTKAGVTVTTQSNLASFYAAATTGPAGAEVSKWESTLFSKHGDYFTGGKYWPISNPEYHFYASNCPLSFAAGGTTVQPSTDTDVICAYQGTTSFQEPNTLTFSHIFARIWNVTVNAKDGYTISNVSIKITPKTSGIYNLRTGYGKTDGSGWSGLVTGTATELSAGGPGANICDLYLVPGSYTLTATWTATRGDYVETFTAKTKDVELVAGKLSNISTTLGGQAVDVQFRISVTEWGDSSLSVEFPLS